MAFLYNLFSNYDSSFSGISASCAKFLGLIYYFIALTSFEILWFMFIMHSPTVYWLIMGVVMVLVPWRILVPMWLPIVLCGGSPILVIVVIRSIIFVIVTLAIVISLEMSLLTGPLLMVSWLDMVREWLNLLIELICHEVDSAVESLF